MNGKMHSETGSGAFTSDGMRAEILNPFVHKLELDNTYDKIKTAIFTIILLPFRVIVICYLIVTAWFLACIGLYGLTEDDLRRAPMTGWRSKLRHSILWCVRLVVLASGFHRVKIKGRENMVGSSREAPVLVIAPHSSFFDAVAIVCLGAPSVVARADTAKIPFIGQLINYTQPVYVWRDDPNSRQNTIKEIIARATSKEDWPQVLIFPEGTCTNRSCLITFKPGGFYPGVPVQPVTIRYPNSLDTVTWTWEGPGALKLLWLTLTQVHSACEIEFLPVYHPSEEEKRDPKLYARNVRDVMAKALGVPVLDYTYDDCRLIARAKQLGIPAAPACREVQQLRQALGLHKQLGIPAAPACREVQQLRQALGLHKQLGIPAAPACREVQQLRQALGLHKQLGIPAAPACREVQQLRQALGLHKQLGIPAAPACREVQQLRQALGLHKQLGIPAAPACREVQQLRQALGLHKQLGIPAAPACREVQQLRQALGLHKQLGIPAAPACREVQQLRQALGLHKQLGIPAAPAFREVQQLRQALE
ncbi:hypothetical protein JYU34_020962 [Plutella xylostella]|uniref:Phospholipid/glycerol acyltransferase domain-containing protein n=1 Tax=Plutella xylostella TaxID=51655 RepID=A0ABQ7PSW4_PLUXY|nr:hypothetical protein JYU34_020962 [Plutella xylostella]